SLTRLRNNQQQRVFIEYRIAIAKLGSVIDFDGNACELFDHVFAGESGVQRSSARGNLDGSESFEIGFCERLHLIKKNASRVERDPAFDSLANGARLLVNLLEHEMLEAAFLC